jgi:hypothetical protein
MVAGVEQFDGDGVTEEAESTGYQDTHISSSRGSSCGVPTPIEDNQQWPAQAGHC